MMTPDPDPLLSNLRWPCDGPNRKLGPKKNSKSLNERSKPNGESGRITLELVSMVTTLLLASDAMSAIVFSPINIPGETVVCFPDPGTGSTTEGDAGGVGATPAGGFGE